MCHTDHQRGDVRLRARATGAPRFRAVVLLGHERAIPTQDGVRRDDTRDGRQAAPAKNLAFHRQAAPLVVGKAQPVRPVRGAQDPILLKQVVNDRLLIPVNPA